MFATDLELDIDQELPEIPAEYQELFRQAIQQELADTEQNRTDADILAYLRSRRDDFKRGGFIRPDGRPGAMTLSPEAMYEQALPELAKSSLGEADEAAERRRTLLKMGVLVIAALVFFLLASRGRSQSDAEQNAAGAGTPAGEVAGEGTLAPTPPLPEISGADDSLQTIGGLGGALTIGRPSAIEIHYSRSEETIALAIDPSRPTPKGELRYNEATMRSDNPVAVWLFGAVLNYAIGIPDSLVRNLAAGDRLVLSTDTGASLRFVVTETGQGANYETGRLLSQNRLGLTLFALPAVSEDDVAFALAGYDIATEESQEQAAYEIGDRFALGEGELQLSAVQFGHNADGSIRIVVSGATNDVHDNQTILLSLASSSQQTTAVPLAPDGNGAWQAVFALPDTVSGLPLLAEFRSALPGGTPAVVRLGEVPRLVEQLQVEITAARLDGEQARISVRLSIHNPGAGAVYLDSEFIQMPERYGVTPEGGDAYEVSMQVTPRLPILLEPGETLGLMVTFPWRADAARLQIGAGLWALAE